MVAATVSFLHYMRNLIKCFKGEKQSSSPADYIWPFFLQGDKQTNKMLIIVSAWICTWKKSQVWLRWDWKENCKDAEQYSSTLPWFAIWCQTSIHSGLFCQASSLSWAVSVDIKLVSAPFWPAKLESTCYKMQSDEDWVYMKSSLVKNCFDLMW